MSDDLNGAIADLEKAEAEIERLRSALKQISVAAAPWQLLTQRHYVKAALTTLLAECAA